MKSCRNIHHQENHPSINPAPQLLNQYSSLVISEECMATALPCLSCPDPHLLEKPQESESGVWKRMSLNPASLFFSKWRPFEGAQRLHLTLRLSFSFLFFAEILSHLLPTLHFHSGHCSQEVKRMTWFGEVPRLPFALNFPGLFHMGEMSVVWFLRRRGGFSKIATCTSLHVSAAHTKPGEIDCNSKQKRENMTR